MPQKVYFRIILNAYQQLEQDPGDIVIPNGPLFEDIYDCIEDDNISDYIPRSDMFERMVILELEELPNINGSQKEYKITNIISAREIFNNEKLCIKMLEDDDSLFKYVTKTPFLCLKAVEIDPDNIQHVPDEMKTEEIMLTAAKKDGNTLVYMENQTQNICLAAVGQNGWALRHVKEQTPEINLTAVKQNGLTLQFVKEQTPEICLEAVKQNGFALEYVKEQTPEICLAAVRQNGAAVKFVEEKTEKIFIEAVKQNPKAIQYVQIKDETENICMAALEGDPSVLMDIYNQTPEICKFAVRKDADVYHCVRKENITPDICIEALKGNPALIEFMEQTPELCLEAVRRNGNVLHYVKNKSEEVCLEAIKQNPSALRYIPNEEKTIEECVLAVSIDGSMMKYIQKAKLQDVVAEKINRMNSQDKAHLGRSSLDGINKIDTRKKSDFADNTKNSRINKEERDSVR